MRPIRTFPPAAILALLSGCAPPVVTCLLPAQQTMQMIDLYFGRDIEGRAPLTDAEWANFTRQEITPRFPDGFTVIDATGQWLNPDTHIIGGEASKVVRIAAPYDAGLAARVSAVTGAYRRQFHQRAVGITSAPVCAAF